MSILWPWSSLTYFPAFDLNSLLGLQRMEASISVMVLDEAIRAFH